MLRRLHPSSVTIYHNTGAECAGIYVVCEAYLTNRAINSELANSPNALWAVFVASHQSGDLEVRKRCGQIVAEWSARSTNAGLRKIVVAAGGDFDRFLNSQIGSSLDDLTVFGNVSAM